MAVPARDFGRDGWMGARMTAARAVENGYSIVRSSRQGLLGAVDPAGRAIVERASSQRATVVMADLPVGRHTTLYSRAGNVFGWACLAATALLLLVSGRPLRGREARERDGMEPSSR